MGSCCCLNLSLHWEHSHGRAASWVLSFLRNGEITAPLPITGSCPWFTREVPTENYFMKYLLGSTPDQDGPAASQVPSKKHAKRSTNSQQAPRPGLSPAWPRGAERRPSCPSLRPLSAARGCPTGVTGRATATDTHPSRCTGLGRGHERNP